MEEKARIIQELVPGKQVTIAHLIAHPDEDLAKKMGVPGAEAVGILTLSPREAAMIEWKGAGCPLPVCKAGIRGLPPFCENFVKLP